MEKKADYLPPPESAKSHSPTVPLCPFDLLLTGRQDMCWFLEQMKEKLDTDQRTNRYRRWRGISRRTGCR